MSDKDKLEKLRLTMQESKREYDDARHDADCARLEERGREEKWAKARDEYEAFEDELRQALSIEPTEEE